MIRAAVSAFVLLAAPLAAHAQADAQRMMYRMGSNQLGVLEYCQENGHVGAEVVALQHRMLTMLPPAQVDGLDEAEATGRKGVVSFGGTSTALPDAARAQNTTVAALCARMGEMLKQQAGNLPQ